MTRENGEGKMESNLKSIPFSPVQSLVYFDERRDWAISVLQRRRGNKIKKKKCTLLEYILLLFPHNITS